MAREPFTADDLGTIDAVLRHYPRAADIIRLVRRIGAATQYPITSFAALEDALGGEDATLQLGGQERPLANVRHRIPAFYFPIASEADLVAKLVELLGRRPGPQMEGRPDMPPREIIMRKRIAGEWGPRKWMGGPPAWGGYRGESAAPWGPGRPPMPPGE